MRKVLFVFASLLMISLTGCNESVPTDEVTYTRNNQEMNLTITHRNRGNSCSVTIKNAADAKKYRERLEKLVKEIEDFEKELSIREKSN